MLAVSCCTSAFASYVDYDADNGIYDGQSYAKTEMFAEDFDGYADIAAATDNKWKGSVDFASITADKDGGKAVTIVHNGEDTKIETEFYKDVNVSCANGPVLVSEEVCFSDNESKRALMPMMHWVDSSTRYEINGLYAHENGYFCLDFDGEQKLMPYSAHVWYTVSAVVDAAAHTVEYIIDGKVTSEKIAINENFANITRLTPIKQKGTTAVGTVSVDNCKVYSLQESLIYENNMIIRNGKKYTPSELISDNFDSYTTSGLPDKWLGGDAACIESAKIDDEHLYSVKMTKTTTDVELYRTDSISANSGNNGVYIFSAEYMFGDTSGQRWLMLLPNADKTLIVQSGQFKIKDVGTNLMPFTANKWYTISALVDIPSQKYEYYVDGKLVMEGGFTQTFTSAARITLSRERGNGCWHAVDNFKLTKINEHPSETQFVYDGVKYDGLVIDSDNFDSYEGEKAFPENWNGDVLNENGYVSSVSYDSEHKNSVSVTKVMSDTNIFKNYSSGLFWDKEALYVISADYLFADTSTQKRLMLLLQAANSSGDDTVSKVENFVFMAQNNGKFSYADGTGISAYEKNRWYRIQHVIDVKNQKYMILVNGEPIIDKTDLPGYMCNINRVTLAVQRGAGSVLVDNYSLCKMKKSIDNVTDGLNMVSLYKDGFEPNERTTKTKADNTVNYVEGYDGYAMKLSDADNICAYTDLADSDKKYEKYIFTQNIKFADTTQSRYLFTLKFSNDNESKDALTIKTNGNQLKDANTNEVLMTYEKDKWYKLQMIADVKNSSYDVYINGAYIGSGSYTSPVSNGTLSSVAYISSWGTVHNDVYIDNVAVQTAEEYEIVKSVALYYDDELLEAVSELMFNDTVSAVAGFDTTDCNVIIALYNEDGTLKQIAVDSDMTMPMDFMNCTMKAFVLDKSTFVPQCKEYPIGY